VCAQTYVGVKSITQHLSTSVQHMESASARLVSRGQWKQPSVKGIPFLALSTWGRRSAAGGAAGSAAGDGASRGGRHDATDGGGRGGGDISVDDDMHVGDPRVTFSRNEASAATAAQRLFASYLAAADVVLTSYEALQADLNHADAMGGASGGGVAGKVLRHGKRYRVCGTPLVRIRWWRVCLDEAQMVESTVGRAAEMACRLAAENRWCVSGTPIRRDFKDLGGLIAFLGVNPYDFKSVFDKWLARRVDAGNKAVRRAGTAPFVIAPTRVALLLCPLRRLGC
jgi:E3 ubiquitin-protein ligase SHPRH